MFSLCLIFVGTRFGADIGPLNSVVLVVRANDEPYGDFRFSTVRMTQCSIYDCMCQRNYIKYGTIFFQGSQSVTVSESTGESVVELSVERGPGTFGRVTVDYQVYTYTLH